MKRNDIILRKKFIHYLLPAMLTTAALSLSEFADSMIVANLLGNSGMSIVQLGTPIIFVAAMAYILIGNGGSTLYAISLGQRDNERAGKVFMVSAISSVIIGLLLFTLGFLFFSPLSHLLCKSQELFEPFNQYMSVLLFSVPFLVVILSLVSFLAPSGAPQLATVVNIIANVINIVMDYVYIHFFGMGVEGAAYATLTGYIVAAVPLLLALFSKKLNLKKRFPGKNAISLFKEIVGMGSSFSASQLSFAIRFAFCNYIAARYGGEAGIIALSVCVQAWSISSIFLGAAIEASSPIIAMLHGQKDFQGERLVLRTSFLYQLGLAAICVAFFCLCPRLFASFYHVTEEPELSIVIHALYIFTPVFLFRAIYIQLMKYIQILGFKKYALFISLFDGFAGLVPIAAILCLVFNLDGLWLAHLVTGTILLVICLFSNLFIAKKSKGRLAGVLLSEKSIENSPVLDLTIFDNNQEMINVSEKTRKSLEEYGIDQKTATLVSVLVEESILYTKNRGKKQDWIDILLRAYENRIELDFRSLHSGGNPDEKDERDIAENIRLLKGLASKIEYDYIMGMNSMKVTLLKRV